MFNLLIITTVITFSWHAILSLWYLHYWLWRIHAHLSGNKQKRFHWNCL